MLMSIGRQHIGPGVSGTMAVKIDFDVDFKETPVVSCMIENEHSKYGDTFSLSIREIGKLGFVLNVRRNDVNGAAWGQSPWVSWIAVGK